MATSKQILDIQAQALEGLSQEEIARLEREANTLRGTAPQTGTANGVGYENLDPRVNSEVKAFFVELQTWNTSVPTSQTLYLEGYTVTPKFTGYFQFINGNIIVPKADRIGILLNPNSDSKTKKYVMKIWFPKGNDRRAAISFGVENLDYFDGYEDLKTYSEELKSAIRNWLLSFYANSGVNPPPGNLARTLSFEFNGLSTSNYVSTAGKFYILVADSTYANTTTDGAGADGVAKSDIITKNQV